MLINGTILAMAGGGPIGLWFDTQQSVPTTNRSIVFYCGGTASSTNTLPTGVFSSYTHFAIVGRGVSADLYINGTRIVTLSVSYNIATADLIIGARTAGGGASTAYTGLLSNFRLVVGSALYSGSTLTVPSLPLANIANTRILLLTESDATKFFDTADSTTLTRTGNNVIWST